ncbi:nucleoside-triphosphatase [Anaeromyxobacter oryzisoli]|uniref:nucleoside-triphosphatase n=1 Tax=Anaeromyxobacter oryzisoli TaxID=2925408 RepID=UPI001F58A089|nr:nucleoside-triphosphatase [Anaeromyxobacter sp. SG63]
MTGPPTAGQGQLATAGGRGGPRVGRYGVHVEALDAIGADALEPRLGVDLVVIDEIGKMECMAAAFVRAARRALSGPVPVLGSVALIGAGFIAEAKRLPGVEVIQLTRDDRDRLVAWVTERLRAVQAGFGPDRRGSGGFPEAP